MFKLLHRGYTGVIQSGDGDGDGDGGRGRVPLRLLSHLGAGPAQAKRQVEELTRPFIGVESAPVAGLPYAANELPASTEGVTLTPREIPPPEQAGISAATLAAAHG